MTLLEAKQLASNHTILLNERQPIKEALWSFSNPRAFDEHWLFDYRIIFKEPSDQPIGFGGPPGFTINKVTKEIKQLSWNEFQKIQKK